MYMWTNHGITITMYLLPGEQGMEHFSKHQASKSKNKQISTHFLQVLEAVRVS